MKTALITTTINVPTVLRLYRAYGPDVRFFAALDKKTPQDAVYFCHTIPQLLMEWGEQYKCSELIGWNCIQRRNIALLEALKWGADLIVSIDDDNLPLQPTYFEDFQKLFFSKDTFFGAGQHTVKIDRRKWNGLGTSSATNWFDVGQLLDPIAPHRGFPHTKAAQPAFESVVDAKIGVAAGICLGDPDIGAIERIANAPIVHQHSVLLDFGVVTDPRTTWTVFNSQNTAFIRELAPAMFMLPGVGRMDDIYASLITQRIMRERDLHVHFGAPFVWQQRNQHDLVKDLRQEIDGMENVVKLAHVLDLLLFEDGQSVSSCVETILHACEGTGILPDQTITAGLAWLDDIASVM